MITLGIETSGRQGSVALLRDGTLLGERDLSRQGHRHARTLVPELQELLHSAELKPADVDTLVVSIGPGSFTGLRVGVACAKAWAYATGAAVVAVNTLLAVAHQVDERPQTLQVISDAQRSELFVGLFEPAPDQSWAQRGEITIVPAQTWIAGLQPDDLVCGPGLQKLHDRLSDRCRLTPVPTWLPTAQSIARLGEQAAVSGRCDDLWTLEPGYLRKSAAEEKAEAGER